MRLAMLTAVALVPLLAACGSGTGKVASASTKAPAARQYSRLPPIRQPLRQPPPVAQRLAAPGLEGVIGASRADLLRQFGPARLDVWEGDARKLQFVGNACVLDIYLYPGAPGREPQASYVDARRASDGKDVDRASCIAAMRPRPAPVTPPQTILNAPVPGR